MKLKDALKVSSFGYARRFDAQRQVWCYHTRHREYIQMNGNLIPAAQSQDGANWEPVMADPDERE